MQAEADPRLNDRVVYMRSLCIPAKLLRRPGSTHCFIISALRVISPASSKGVIIIGLSSLSKNLSEIRHSTAWSWWRSCRLVSRCPWDLSTIAPQELVVVWVMGVSSLFEASAPTESSLALCTPHLVTTINLGNIRSASGTGARLLSQGLHIRHDIGVTDVTLEQRLMALLTSPR
jgi:hypothetical protein